MALLITSILRNIQYSRDNDKMETYMIPFLVEHERGNGAAGVGTVTGLTADMDSGLTPTILILSSWDSMSGHWHDGVSCSGG